MLTMHKYEGLLVFSDILKLFFAFVHDPTKQRVRMLNNTQVELDIASTDFFNEINCILSIK